MYLFNILLGSKEFCRWAASSAAMSAGDLPLDLRVRAALSRTVLGGYIPGAYPVP